MRIPITPSNYSDLSFEALLNKLIELKFDWGFEIRLRALYKRMHALLKIPEKEFKEKILNLATTYSDIIELRPGVYIDDIFIYDHPKREQYGYIVIKKEIPIV